MSCEFESHTLCKQVLLVEVKHEALDKLDSRLQTKVEDETTWK